MSILSVEYNIVIYDTFFDFIDNIEYEGEKEVTLLNIKKNLDNYSVRKIRIESVLIDSLYELTTEKNSFEDKVENQELEFITLNLQISETEEMVFKLKSKNLSCRSQLNKANDMDGKGKKEATRLQIDLKEKLE